MSQITEMTNPHELTWDELLRELVQARRAIKKLEKNINTRDARIAALETDAREMVAQVTDLTEQAHCTEQRYLRSKAALDAIVERVKPILAPEIDQAQHRAEQAEARLEKYASLVSGLTDSVAEIEVE